jgi:PAS domain S-box-containing protein
MNSMPDDRPAVVVPGGSEQGESARIQTLRDYGILDSPPERAFDDIALLASLACRTPIALITFIDAGREWCKAAVGMKAASCPRDSSLGAHTIEGSDLLRITDAAKDPRFVELPLVAGERHVRFYAGVPLLAPNGLAVGTLCVMDAKPRRLTHDQEEALRALAGQAVAQLETRRKPNGDNLGKFFEFALDMFCIAGFDGYFKRLNRAWEKTLGYSARQLMERPYLEFIHPDDRESTIAVAGEVASGDELISFENRYGCKDGSYKWLRWTARPAMDEGVIYAVARDITERKNAQEALRASQAKLQAIIDNTPAIVYVKDLDGRYLLINHTFEQLFGVERDAIEGKSDHEVFGA